MRILFVFAFCLVIASCTAQEIDFSGIEKKISIKALFDSSGVLISFYPILGEVDISDYVDVSTIILSIPAPKNTVDESAILIRNLIVSKKNREFISAQDVSYFFVEFKFQLKDLEKVYSVRKRRLCKMSLLGNVSD